MMSTSEAAGGAMSVNEDAQAPAPEPGGFLAAMQRTRCVGATPMTTYQGMLADEIVVPQSAIDASDPVVMVGSVSGYAETMLRQGLYLPGEFALEALTSYYVTDYVAQAGHGGHALYFDRRGKDDIALKCAAAGLKSMVADPHLALFNLMLRLHRSDRKELKRLLRENKWRNADAALRDLDKRFLELEAREPLAPRHKAWLRSLRKLSIMPDGQVGLKLQHLAASNPLRERRRDEYARAQAEREKDDPVYGAVKSLTEMASLRFYGLGQRASEPMRIHWPEGPDRRALIWQVQTDRGVRLALFYSEGAFSKRYLAVLMEEGGALPLGSLSLTKGDYEAIVPVAARK